MVKRKIVHIDEEKCNGCGLCIPSCEEGALKIINGKAKLVDDRYCDGLGSCIGSCPRGAITIIEREAEDFVDLREEEKNQKEEEVNGCCGHEAEADHESFKKYGSFSGCPSSRPINLDSGDAVDTSGVVVETGDVTVNIKPQLKNWPVQMFLINPEADYLKNADLLLAADCVPAVLPLFYLEMLKGKVLIMSCPKQEDQAFYTDKLTEIIRKNSTKSITIAYMEVACCRTLLMSALKAVERSGLDVPVYAFKVGMNGRSIRQRIAYPGRKGA
ncbi:MAG TPA: 4Fe-4S ferredoxin [Peptococcaceae bacterium]|nr:MAG: 4Fe-4S ferredoxin iron-sulfur binding domain protein [Clostridia bacterium 41_269]HBT20637.1 4Fe-4S ferredoxin [Peptococcaceae bacterium]